MTANSRSRLVWDEPSLAAADSLGLRSPDFESDGFIPLRHAAERAGGENLSPALDWDTTADAAQLLLLVEDPDAPTRTPYLHCLALLDPSLLRLGRGALSAPLEDNGVQFARSAEGVGYLGPAPPKTHGPHRYVFELFALEVQLEIPASAPSTDALIERLTRGAEVIARGRLDGLYRRT